METLISICLAPWVNPTHLCRSHTPGQGWSPKQKSKQVLTQHNLKCVTDPFQKYLPHQMPQSLEFPALNLLLLVCSIIHPILSPVSAHVNPICLSRTGSESLFHENFHYPPLGSNLSFLWKFNSTLFMMYSGPLNNMSLNCTSTCTWIFFSRKYYMIYGWLNSWMQNRR